MVDAVDEIDVGVAGRAEHDLGARGEAFGGVGGEVVRAEVGFHFHDFADALDAVGVVNEAGALQSVAPWATVLASRL